MEQILLIVGAILAVLGAAIAGRAALLSKPHRPELAGHMTELVNQFIETVETQRRWSEHLVEQYNVLRPTDPFAGEVERTHREISRSLGNVLERLRPIRGYSEQEKKAVDVRIRIEIGTMLLVGSAALQLSVLALRVME